MLTTWWTEVGRDVWFCWSCSRMFGICMYQYGLNRVSAPAGLALVNVTHAVDSMAWPQRCRCWLCTSLIYACWVCTAGTKVGRGGRGWVGGLPDSRVSKSCLAMKAGQS